MTCKGCGKLLEATDKFCQECGEAVPQTKQCVNRNCGVELPLKAKFCSECGTRQDGIAASGLGLAIGEKNVIAGDVIGKREETHVTGNATIIKNEDETKKTAKCHVCGKMMTVVDGYVCNECNQFTCSKHFDVSNNSCDICSKTKKNKIQEIARQQEREQSQILVETERIILKKAYELLYEEEKPQEAIALLEELYQDHENNTEVLNLYLSTLAQTDFVKAEEVARTVNNVQGYKIQIECAIKKGDLIQAERKLQEAKQRWPTNGTIQLIEVIVKIIQYKKFAEIELIEQGKILVQKVGELKDPIEKSWYYVIKSFLFNEEDKQKHMLEKTFFKTEGMYWSIVNEFYKLVFGVNIKWKDNEIECGIDTNTHKLYWKRDLYKYEYEFNGKGNEIRQKKYNSDGELERKWEFEYDGKGNNIRTKVYNSDGELEYEYEYDEKGNNIREKRYNSDGELKWEYEYEYDEKGNKIRQKEYHSYSEFDCIREYEYDGKGNEIREKKYNLDGELESIWEYEYDEKGNNIREKRYNSDGELERKWEYEYDGKGNKIREKEYEYNSNGELVSETEFDGKGNKIRAKKYEYYSNGELDWEWEYDGKGNNIRTKKYNSDGELESIWENEFDGKGNIIRKKKYNSDGELDCIWEYEYDGQGNKIREKKYNSDGELESICEYEYDGNGNEIRQKEYNSDGELESICEYEYDGNGECVSETIFDGKGNKIRKYSLEEVLSELAEMIRSNDVD